MKEIIIKGKFTIRGAINTKTVKEPLSYAVIKVGEATVMLDEIRTKNDR